jgi:alkylation response protein AidB-like acyl-CoA dehydrogenase
LDLKYSREHEEFRAEVAAFLAANWPPIIDGQPAKGKEAQIAFRKVATEAGYLYRNIPRQYGGSEQPADVIKAQIIGEEFA